MKKLRMKPSQYIAVNSDRVELLNERLQEQKERKKNSTNSIQIWNTSIKKVIEPTKSKENNLDVNVVGEYYKKLFKSKKEQDSPWFDEWLDEITMKSDTLKTQLDIVELTNEALKFTAPWKAPGNDRVPAALYKILPAAKTYLQEHVTKILNN